MADILAALNRLDIDKAHARGNSASIGDEIIAHHANGRGIVQAQVVFHRYGKTPGVGLWVSLADDFDSRKLMEQFIA